MLDATLRSSRYGLRRAMRRPGVGRGTLCLEGGLEDLAWSSSIHKARKQLASELPTKHSCSGKNQRVLAFMQKQGLRHSHKVSSRALQAGAF
eukprot:1136521-Pelagomonas_calceolata.AAC.1